VISAVLDTNVLAPGLANQANDESKPGEMVRRWLAGEFEVVASAHVVEKVLRILTTKRYVAAKLSDAQRQALRENLADLVRLIDAGEVVPGVAPHRHDDPILAAVAASSADYFVAGDAALLKMGPYAGIPFVGPTAFSSILDGASAL